MLLIKNSYIDPHDNEVRLKYSRSMDAKMYFSVSGKYPNPTRVSYYLAPFDELFEGAEWGSELIIEKFINKKGG